MIFWRLGSGMFLPDEAETAVQANAIMRHGWPQVDDDGSRILPFIFGWLNQDRAWIHTPWLDDYVLAGSATLLGPTRFSARLPFALIALAGLFLFVYLARTILAPRAAWLAIILYALSAVYIGQARFARYYVILHISEMLFVLGAYEAVFQKRRRGVFFLILSHFLCFYCNYISAIMHGLSFGIWTVLLGRPYRQRLMTMMSFYLGAFLVSAPWLFYINFKLFGEIGTLTFFSDANRIGSGPQFSVEKVIRTMGEYAVGFEMSLFSVVVIVPVIVWGWIQSKRKARRETRDEGIYGSETESLESVAGREEIVLYGPKTGKESEWRIVLLCLIHCLATIVFCGFLPVYAERYILFLLPSAKLLLGVSVATLTRRAQTVILAVLIGMEFICHPLRLVMPATVDSLVHSGNLATLFRSIFVRHDDEIMEFVEKQKGHAGAIQTVGEEMYLIYRYPHRQFRCADYGLKNGAVLPDVVFTESLMGYYDFDHYVPIFDEWLKYYDRVEIPVSPETIHPIWTDGRVRPWVIYLKKADAPRSFEDGAFSDEVHYRRAWLADPSSLLQPVIRDDGVSMAVTRSGEAKARVILGGVRKEAFLRGGMKVEEGRVYRIRLNGDEKVVGMEAFLRDADKRWNGEMMKGAGEAGEWTLDLRAAGSSSFAQIVIDLELDGETGVLSGWSVEGLGR
jgi:hypothetical protein